MHAHYDARFLGLTRRTTLDGIPIESVVFMRCTLVRGFHSPGKPGKLLEFYVRPGIFGIISRFMLVLTL